MRALGSGAQGKWPGRDVDQRQAQRLPGRRQRERTPYRRPARWRNVGQDRRVQAGQEHFGQVASQGLRQCERIGLARAGRGRTSVAESRTAGKGHWPTKSR